MVLYQRLKITLQPEDMENFAADLREFQKIHPGRHRRGEGAPGERRTSIKDAFDEYTGYLGQYDEMARFAYPLIVPPSHPDIARRLAQCGSSAL